MDQNNFRYFPYFLSFLTWHPCKIQRKNLRSLNYFLRGFVAPLRIMRKPFSDGQGRPFFVRSLNYFWADFWPPWKTWKSTLDDPPWNPRTLGPCPDDRAQNSVLDSFSESSVRPNPTLVFSKIRSQCWPLGRYFGKVFWAGILGGYFGQVFWAGILGRYFGQVFWEGI